MLDVHCGLTPTQGLFMFILLFAETKALLCNVAGVFLLTEFFLTAFFRLVDLSSQRLSIFCILQVFFTKSP